MYFFKWLNAEVFKEMAPDSIIMYDKKRQNGFAVSIQTANTLVEEGMAQWLDESYVALLFDRKEFSNYILERDHHTCHYCGGVGDTIDHVYPQDLGGMSTPKNCVAACYPCNQKKGNQITL
jgi:hypothetical protein